MELPPVAKITGTNVKEFARCAFAFRKLIPALPNEHSSITWSANIYTAFAGNVTNVSSHVSMQTDLFVFEKQGKYIYIYAGSQVCKLRGLPQNIIFVWWVYWYEKLIHCIVEIIRFIEGSGGEGRGRDRSGKRKIRPISLPSFLSLSLSFLPRYRKLRNN